MSIYARFLISISITFIFVIIFIAVIPAYVEEPVFIPGFAPGPAVWPNTITLTGIFVGILSIIFTIPQLRREGKLLNASRIKESFSHNKVSIQRSCLSVVILISYVYIVPVLGIIIASTILLTTLFLFIGIKEKMKWMVSLTIIFPTAIYLLFTNVTHTMFPYGSVWENLGLF